MKAAAIILAVVILILLGVFIFWNPAQGPTTPAVSISMPASGAVIDSPVGIEGQAPGAWFFEASFPIKVLDGDGTILGTGTAQALGNWMTTGTVAFSANIPFTAPHYATGTIVFANDNPSGASENAEQFDLSVRFK